MFAQGEVIGGDVVLGTREALFGDGELVHEREADCVFLGGEIDGGKDTAELLRRFPTDLTAQTGFVAAGLNGMKAAKECEENRLDEMPIFGATGEEGDELEVRAFDAVDV